MFSYLLKRLFGLVPQLVGITLISFLVIHLAPGGPVDARGDMNPKMSYEAKEKLTKLYGLDKPVLIQYKDWLKRLVGFDFGNSFTDGEKVTQKIARAIPVTLFINLLALLLIFLIGIPIGVFGAVKENSMADKTVTLFVMSGFAVPTFWLALILMSFFGVTLRCLPVSGLYSIDFDQMSWLGKTIDLSRHLILPLVVSSVTGVAGISRFMRSGMIEALRSDYIRTARAKGLSENRVLYRHALRNALLPIVTILGLSVPGLLGGSVVFESIFSIPGMGRLFFNSVFTRDYPVIMGVLVLGAALTLLGNLLADIAYGLVDPRIRLK
ncbi:MAG: diguanylate cyclase [Candidatus Omnitrophica bacterium CG1_02_46_14]|nr:MAG: diguanylate cyclase [Candidatus Omnitrophica bacterium CG1_02_46_14]